MALVNRILRLPEVSHVKTEKSVQSVRTHREVVIEFAKLLGTPYIEVGLGSLWAGAPRVVDVVDIRKSYANFAISIYEIKVSRADFLAELRNRKWRDSLVYCERFYYVTLEDVAFAEEIPSECGWFVRSGDSWILKRNAKKRKIDYPREFLLALIFKRKVDK